MATLWKEQLQKIIELSHDRIKGLETGVHDCVASERTDTTRLIEVEKKNIVRLQRTIEALD